MVISQGCLYQNVMVTGMRSKRVKALLDSGAGGTAINGKVAQYIQPQIIGETTILFGNNHTSKVEIGKIQLKIYNKVVDLEVYIFPKEKEEMVIGADFFQRYGAIINFKSDKITM